MDEWEPINSQTVYVKPTSMKVGDFITGVFVETTKDAKYGSLKHHLLQEDGSTKILNGSGQLNHILKAIKPGTKLKIEFAGKVILPSGPFKGKESNQWKVHRAKGDAQEVVTGNDFAPGDSIADKILAEKKKLESEEIPF